MTYDLAIVGAGILGLGHALAAARRGLRVVVLERDPQALGASIRNFGFVTVSGQQQGACWRLARRSAEVWATAAEAARIPVLHHGLLVAARLEESEPVIDAFLATEMGASCRKLTGDQARALCPALSGETRFALHSPHEARVESRDAIPRLAAWLGEAMGVEIRYGCAVHEVVAPRIETSHGVIEAERVVVCPGDDFRHLFPDRLAALGLTRCKLHMLRVAPSRSFSLGAAVMSDHGLARYRGYADLPEAAALKARLDRDFAACRENGVHLIVVQSADGSLVVGDSHHYSDGPDPFQPEEIDRLILDEMDAALDLPGRLVTERWLGTYASADAWLTRDAPDAATRIVIVSAGCGASTAFGIGEETIAELFEENPA